MTDKDSLLESIANTTADYREGDLAAPTPEHVERWVNQFDPDVRLPILNEMDHVLKQAYFSRKKTGQFLSELFKTEKLVGDDPCAFWRSVKFLDIQGGGASQKEMLALFAKILKTKCGFSIDDCGGNPKVFVYLDDAIFSGGRVSHDLTSWIANDAPDSATLHVIVIATHESSYYNRNKVDNAIRSSGKSIKITWWHAVKLEDRKKYTDSSDVLRPVSIPTDPAVLAYANALSYPPQLRNAGQVGGLGIFSSDEGRQILEQEFLKAGTHIRAICPNFDQYQRPLGRMLLDTLGFGSMIVTFRNCPNNAPLALWAGDPWYPLFPRSTNSDTSLKRFIAILAKDVFE
ncbi:MAG: hypothetical protein FKY71_07525 [Spiribacter salinus]|uniref:PRTase-CE domain-containing protein n=1 Tax=Spiribacter salinus TaxID=1335746 RepID=A0A540VSB1_9GAMM|nr:MAG: hypothetical protein FKY71_07525 [Spiribacter salinus]